MVPFGPPIGRFVIWQGHDRLTLDYILRTARNEAFFGASPTRADRRHSRPKHHRWPQRPTLLSNRYADESAGVVEDRNLPPD